jgi:hypothetical protein
MAASPVHKDKLTFTVPNAGWGTPQRVRLGDGGRICRVTLRAPAGSSVTAADYMIWEGDTDAGYTAGFDPTANVPQEDRVIHQTSIVVVGSATAADDDYFPEAGGDPYPVYEAISFQRRTLWASIRGTAGLSAQAGVVLAVTAIDTRVQ